MPDENERLVAGTLADPEANTEPQGPPGLAPTLGALLPKAFARMRARASGKERPIPLPWPSLTKRIGGGLWPGLHVLVGGTGTGKTQWCLQVALEAAKADTPVLYVALEAIEEEVVARCLGLEAGTYWSALYHGRRDDDDREALNTLNALIKKHTPALEKLRLHVQFPPPYGWPSDTLPKAVETLRTTYPEKTPGDTPLLVILDFLQIVGATDPRHDLRERIARAAYHARGVARTHNAAVLVASSTAREYYAPLAGRKRNKRGEDENEKLGQGPPDRFVGSGKESGEIEFGADTHITLTKEPWKSDTPPRGGTVYHLAVGKVRAGVPAWVELRFDGNRFTEPPNKESLPGAPTR